MSERRLMLSIALAAAFFAAPPAGAQRRSATADSLLRDIRHLDSVMLSRSHSVDSIRRSLVRPLPPVEVHRGALRVRTDSMLAPQVRLALDSVSALIDRHGGTLLASRVATRVFVAAPDSTPATFWMRRVVTLAADTARRWTLSRAEVESNPSAAQLVAGLTMLVEQIAMHGVDSTLAAWVMIGRAPLRDPTAHESADAYIELATSESSASRRCRAHDVPSCLDVLGIDSLPGRRLERWYAPEDYRGLLRAVAPPQEDSAAVVAWIRCRDERAEAACRAAAVALPNDRVPMPLSASARHAFLREVLDAGGPGAYDRLLTATGTLRSRLTVAAREPLDATVARWLERVERSRPDRMRLPAGLVVAALGWIAMFVALTLVRRTAWA